MPTPADKRQLLEQAGYAYGFDREVYYNRNTRKVFSVEFVEDHNAEELETCISENTQQQEWRFYFNSTPPDAVRRELESVLQ